MSNPLIEVLQEIYRHPKRLQSNFSRENSQVIARLASTALISTEIPASSGQFGYHWRVTVKGLRVIELIGEDE